MVTNMLYGGPFRDMRLLQEEVNRLAQSAAPPQATFPAINVYAHQDGIVITAELPGVQQDGPRNHSSPRYGDPSRRAPGQVGRCRGLPSSRAW